MSTVTLPKSPYSGPPRAKRDWIPLSELEFPGCEMRPMTLADFEAHDGPIEFFDSESGVAWLIRERGELAHEASRCRLNQLVGRVSQARGSPIHCYGMAEMRLCDAESGRFRSIHADQLLFLRPDDADLRTWAFLEVGRHPHPDLVLEVDHSTDVRRNRLKLYEEWGFPEVWIEVPEVYTPNRPRGLRPGFEIHLLKEGRFVRSPVSRAFPGWRTTEIHRALNEADTTPETGAALDRVGRALGAPEGTGPEDDVGPGRLLRELRAGGGGQSRFEAAEIVLTYRCLKVPYGFWRRLSPEDRAAFGDAAPEALEEAVWAASSLADFIARVRDAAS